MLTSHEINIAILVARAAPATSMPKPATNTKSNTILEIQDTTRNHNEALLSPSPLNIPAFML